MKNAKISPIFHFDRVGVVIYYVLKKKKNAQNIRDNIAVDKKKSLHNTWMALQQTKMDHPQPLSVIFPQIYPLLKRAAEVWIKDPDVMDTLSSVLKQVIWYIILIIFIFINFLT